MALRESAITVRFGGGVNTKPDGKTVPTTQLLALENGVFDKAITLKKRNGYRALGRRVNGSPSLLSGARRLASRLSELLAFTSNTAYSYQPSADSWQSTGAAFSTVASIEPGVRTGTMQTTPDHASNGGLTAFAWEDSRGGVWWAAVYTDSGQVCRGPEQLDANGAAPRCVAVGDVIHVYWTYAASRFINVAVVNPAMPSSAPVQRTIIDDLHSTNGAYDVCSTERTGSPAFIAWQEHASTNVRLGYVDASGVLGSPLTGHPSVVTYSAGMASASPIACDWFGDTTEGVIIDDYLTVAYVSGADAHVAAFASASGTVAITLDEVLVPIETVTSVQRIALRHTAAGVGYVAIEEAAAETTQRYCRVNRTSFDSTVSRTLRSVGLASRAFAIGDDTFATFVHAANLFGTYLVLRLSDFAPAGRLLPGQAVAPARRHLASAHVDGDAVTVALPSRQRLPDSTTFTETGITLACLDFDSEDSHVSATLGRGLYLASGCPLHYDGKAWTELGFHVGPELIVGTPAGGGSLTPERVYVYRAWYEWTDAQGETHRGPMSTGTNVELAAGQSQVTLTLPTLRVTGKSNVRICVGRSKGNDETQLWRITSMDPNTAGAVNGYVANSTTVDTATLVDRMSDLDLVDEEPLYTNGGILSNDPAPFGSVLASGKSRLFFTDPSEPDRVRFSQPLDDGYGVECPPELSTVCDPHGGAVRALAVMDEVVVVFKETAIYAFAGDGPLPNGAVGDGAGFSAPQLLTSDVGCTDPNSIALTPVGLVFKSAKGIYLLGRDRSVSYIGAPVEAYNAQSVRRATVLPDRTAVVFLTDDGLSLYWDYFYQQWSTFTNHAGHDAAIALGAYHYLRTDERIFVETIGAHADDGRPIRFRLETAWIHMQEHLQGFQRFYEMLLIGERKSAHQLRVQYRTDYGGHWSDPEYLDATGQGALAGWVGGSPLALDEDPLVGSSYGDGAYGDGPYGGIAPGLYQWRVHLCERAQSIQFRFEDYEQAAGPSFELTEMTITGGVKANTTRPIAAGRAV